MSINPKYQPLIAALREARELLARPSNDFTWSTWEDESAALEEIDELIRRIEMGLMPEAAHVRLLFLPTGPIQEVSLSSGWGEEFLQVSAQFDVALETAYGPGLLARLQKLLK